MEKYVWFFTATRNLLFERFKQIFSRCDNDLCKKFVEDISVEDNHQLININISADG